MSPPRASSTANTSGGLDSKGWGNLLVEQRRASATCSRPEPNVVVD